MITSISDLLKQGKKLPEEPTKKVRGGINSAKADAVERLMREVMNDDPHDSKRFKYWLGRTRKLSASGLHQMIGSAKEGRKPAALFNHLLKHHGTSNTAKNDAGSNPRNN